MTWNYLKCCGYHTQYVDDSSDEGCLLAIPIWSLLPVFLSCWKSRLKIACWSTCPLCQFVWWRSFSFQICSAWLSAETQALPEVHRNLLGPLHLLLEYSSQTRPSSSSRNTLSPICQLGSHGLVDAANMNLTSSCYPVTIACSCSIPARNM